jgi:hypothetical protein
MKKAVIAAVLVVSSFAAMALTSAKVGGIDYAEGAISIGEERPFPLPTSATRYSPAT